MKISGKKILIWSFWPILALFIFGSYFLIPKEENQEHLLLVPSNAEFVIIVNPLNLVKTYSKLLKENPVAFGEMEVDLDEEEMKFGKGLGFNPLKKMAIFQFTQESNNYNGIGLLAEVSDFEVFVETFNKRDNKEKPTIFKGGQYLLLPKDNEFFLFKDGVGVMVKSDFVDVSKVIAEQCFEDIFEAKTHLYNLEPTFEKQVNNPDQFSYWSKKGSNLMAVINPQLAVINNLFDRKEIKINLTENGFQMNAFLELMEENSIIPREYPDELVLQNTECFRFTASVNPEKFSNFFEVIIPEDKKYLVSNWNGGISASIDGFKNISIKKVTPPKKTVGSSPDSLYPFLELEEDLIKFELPIMGGGLDEIFSYPYFTIACELNDIEALKQQIESDSTISNIGAYYSFVLPGYTIKKDDVKQKQRVYFYFVDNSLVFCPDLPEKEFQPQYNNFGVLFDFDAFFSSYETKGMTDDFVMNMLEDFEFKGFELKYVTVANGFVQLDGIFQLKNTDNHLIGFPVLLKKIMSMPILMSLPSAL